MKKHNSPPLVKLEMDRLRAKHVQQLSKYPKPNPHHHIQVTMLDMYRDNAFVLATSFADLSGYDKAVEVLGWDYDLVSEQVDICCNCGDYYLVIEKVSDQEGFCQRECFLENKFSRRMAAEALEYDRFAYGDFHECEIPFR